MSPAVLDPVSKRLDTSVHYRRMDKSWPRGSNISFLIEGCDRLFLVPIDFLKKAGCNTLRFVEELAQELVIEQGVLLAEGMEVRRDKEPEMDVDYIFSPVGDGEFHWFKGPESGSTGKKAKVVDDGDDSTSFVSTSNSSAQNELRLRLLVRDGRCVVSGVVFTSCDAAHLVPKIRTDALALALGNEFDGFSYLPSMGVLLAKTLHKQYDDYRWSFRGLANGSMIVHVFDPNNDQDLLKIHGTVITRDSFRIFSEDRDYPDLRLCSWHYRQTVNKHLRGFSAGFAFNAN